MKRVLIIAAHPDDEILGCGGTIAKYRGRGVEFGVLFIAEGSSCRFENPTCLEAKDAIKSRTCDAKIALSLLGVNRVLFTDFPCGRLDQIPLIQINKLIEKEIREFRPDTIFTHSSHDANNDHRIVFNATIIATRPGAQNHVLRLLSYEVLSSTEWGFNSAFAPNYFESLSANELDTKYKALGCYKTELRSYPFPRSQEGLQSLAMFRGMQVGCKYAEAFQILREISI